jgi:hypothetical protein
MVVLRAIKENDDGADRIRINTLGKCEKVNAKSTHDDYKASPRRE